VVDKERWDCGHSPIIKASHRKLLDIKHQVSVCSICVESMQIPIQGISTAENPELQHIYVRFEVFITRGVEGLWDHMVVLSFCFEAGMFTFGLGLLLIWWMGHVECIACMGEMGKCL